MSYTEKRYLMPAMIDPQAFEVKAPPDSESSAARKI
jgi:hypothetical protein